MSRNLQLTKSLLLSFITIMFFVGWVMTIILFKPIFFIFGLFLFLIKVMVFGYELQLTNKFDFLLSQNWILKFALWPTKMSNGSFVCLNQYFQLDHFGGEMDFNKRWRMNKSDFCYFKLENG